MWLPSPTRPGRLAPDAGEEASEGVFVGEAGAEVDPGVEIQESGDFLDRALVSSREDDRDDPERVLSGCPHQGGFHLPRSPGSASRPRSDENSQGTALNERLVQPSDPALAGNEVPLVEERLEPRLLELAGEVLHGRLVGAGVAEEDVVAAHGRSTCGLSLF